MAETPAEAIRRLRKERAFRREELKKLNTRLEKLAHRRALVRARVKKINAKLKRLVRPDVPPMQAGGWHPNAARSQVQFGLDFMVGVGKKMVDHTTEGFGLPVYSGSHPHFTVDLKKRLLWQHVPVIRGAFALRNLSGGVETNRAGAIQVEIIGFARESHTWSDGEYAFLAELARWIEKHCGVPRKCDVIFRSDANHKVGNWNGYAGHIGHQHVPENDHWDPGLLQIQKVLR